MSEYFGSDDPFADFTAGDFDILEDQAIAASQTSYIPPSRTTSFQNVFQPLKEEEPIMEDDYGQFNVDDEDLFIDDNNNTTPPAPPPRLSRFFPTNIDQTALMEELAHLRAETSRLKLERDKFETLAYTQDGKMDHLQRSLQKAKNEHDSVLQRLQRTSESEKRALQLELQDREKKLVALTADIEFQKNELREAREIANRGGIIRSTNLNNNIDCVDILNSPKKAARVVKGSGVKSPESKSKVGVFSARAFSKEESVGPVKGNNNNNNSNNYNKKRKREEVRMITPEPVVVSEDSSEVEINRIVMEKILRERSTWTASDERFEVYILMDEWTDNF